MVLYPGSIDDNTTLPDPTSSDYVNAPTHSQLHTNENDAIIAIETKVGTGSSTPPGSGYILTSSSSGQSSWQPPAPAGVWGAITGTLSDQTDLQAALNAKLSLSGGTMTGNLTLAGAPSTNLMAATKKYVDDADALKLNLSGGTLTGALILAADPVANLGAATKQYVDNLGTVSMVINEVPGGSVNGSNVNFTTASTYATGTLEVYLNGQRLLSGSGNDYVEVSSGFTMQYAPATGDVLLVGYLVSNTTRFIQGSNSIIVQETPSGSVNSSNTVFTTLQGKYVANSLEVFLNGLQMTKTTDYTETSPGAGTFTMAVAPTTGDVIRVSYQFATGASGNADTVDGVHASDTGDTTGVLIADYYGWKKLLMTLTYASASTFTVTGDYRNLFTKGSKLWLTQTTSKYFYVTGSSYSAPNTTVTVNAGTDYTLASAAITAPYISGEMSPYGFPQWFNYTPAWTGFGGNPALGNGTRVGRFSITGGTVKADLTITMGSTTTYGSGEWSLGLPVAAAAAGTNYHGSAWALDSGTAYYSGGAKCAQGATVMQGYNSAAGSNSWGSGVPHVWATNDILSMGISYEF